MWRDRINRLFGKPAGGSPSSAPSPGPSPDFYVVSLDPQNPFRRFHPSDVPTMRMPGDVRIGAEFCLMLGIFLVRHSSLIYLIPYPLVSPLFFLNVWLLYRVYRAFFWRFAFPQYFREVEKINQDLQERCCRDYFSLSYQEIPRFGQMLFYRGSLYNMLLLKTWYLEERRAGRLHTSIREMVKMHPTWNAVTELIFPCRLQSRF
ncbi:MAG: hypothetical protein IJ083_09050 [Clostridia bacterium]|nr:hypothetical protein [Clostridia bacterium]